MKKLHLLLKIAMVLSVVFLLATVFDLLALHDVYKDYVSKTVLQYLEIDLSEELPSWTDTPGEWRDIQIIWVFRLLFAFFIIFVLNACKRYTVKTLQELKAAEEEEDYT
ncbi:hypothetical protein JW935_13940 [candidate division KSB1 bacterium]|nr:hypothetical protein [candidate division KSB1 bacterium]